MKIEFTIGWAWVEFLCHFLAAFLYISSGYSMARNHDEGLFTLLMAIGLTIIGAHL